MSLTALSPVVGLLLLALVLVDAFRTVLLPSASGPLNRALTVAVWALVRALPRRARLVGYRLCGPLLLVLSVVVWLLGLWLGFACLYWPLMDTMAYSSDVDFGAKGFPEALYLSATCLTTLGFGDIVGAGTWVRLLTVVEAASGLAVLTAALGYLPAIYTLVSELRTANQAVADLGLHEDGAADELLGEGATTVLDQVRRDVLAARQHLQRFPVLHYFHPSYDESVVSLLRGAVVLWVAAHEADEQDRGPSHDRQVRALGRAVGRLVGELSAHAGRGGRAHERGRREGEQPTLPEPEGLARLQAVLDAYAEHHGYPAETSGVTGSPGRAGGGPGNG